MPKKDFDRFRTYRQLVAFIRLQEARGDILPGDALRLLCPETQEYLRVYTEYLKSESALVVDMTLALPSPHLIAHATEALKERLLQQYPQFTEQAGTLGDARTR